MNQRGRNSGLTGLIDLPGIGEGAKFEVKISRWQVRQGGVTRPRRGRGGGKYRSVRWIMGAGTFVCWGKPRMDGWPAPDRLEGQAGTILIQIHEDKTITYPLTVRDQGLDLDEKTVDVPDLYLACEVTGAPTYEGWGEGEKQPEATDPTKADQEQYEGTTKIVDPQGLQTGATRVIDVWGDLADTDTAEAAKLTAVISAALPPLPGLKLRSATYARDAADGGTITEIWGLTDTAEDVVNPITRAIVDPESILSEATSAAINETPATPTGDDFVKVTTSSQELNDGKRLYTDTYALRSSKQAIEMDESEVTDDPLQFADGATITKVTASATPPPTPPLPGYVYRTVTKKEINSKRWKYIFRYGLRTTREDIEFEASEQTDDPTDLADEATICVTNDAETYPATPPAPLGTKLVDIKFHRINQQRWAFVFYYARRDRKDAIEQDGTFTNTDVADLRSDGQKTTVHDTGSPPSDPTPPGGLQIVNSSVHELNNAKSKKVWKYAKDTSKQEVEQNNSFTATDPNGIASMAQAAEVDGNPALPGGFVERESRVSQVTHDHAITVKKGGLRSTVDDIEMPGSWQETDPLGIKSKGLDTTVHDTGSPPAVPTPAAGLQNVFKRVEEININKSSTVWAQGVLNSEQEIEFPKRRTLTDPNDLESLEIQADVFANSSPPADPSAPAGLKLDNKEDKPVTPDKSVRVWDFAKTDSKDRAKFPKTFTETDPNGLTSQAARAEVDVAPSVPVGFVDRGTRTQPLTDGHNLFVREAGLRSTVDDIEMPGSYIDRDPADLRTTGKETEVYTTASGVPEDPTPPAGLKITGSRETQLNQQKSAKQWDLGKNTSQDEAEQQNSFILTDPQGIASEAQVAKVDAAPSLPAGYVSRGTKVQNLTPDHVLNTVEGGKRSTADDIEMPGTETVTDPHGIKSHGRDTEVYDTAGPVPSDPAVPLGQQIVARSSQQVNQDKSKRLVEFAVNNSKQEIEFPRTKVSTDPKDLESFEFKCTVFELTSPPADPTVPDGLLFVDSFDVPVTSMQSVRVWKYAKNDSQSDLEQRNSRAVVDPSAIATETRLAKLDAVPTVPVGQVSRGMTTQKPTPDHTLYILETGLRTTAQDIEFPGTYTIIDPTGLEGSGRKTTVYASSGDEPDDPTPPAGLQIVSSRIDQVNIERNKKLWEFAVNTPAQERIFAVDKTITDPHGLESIDIQADIITIATPPSDPSAPAGLKFDQKWDKQLTPTQALRVWEFRKTDSKDRVLFPRAYTETDPSGLQSQAVAADLNSAPALPAGFVERSTRTQTLTDGNVIHLKEGGLRTTQQDIEFPGTYTDIDPHALQTQGRKTTVYENASPPSDPAPPSGTKIVSSRILALTGERSQRAWQFDVFDSAEKIIVPDTVSRADPVQLTDHQTASIVAMPSTVEALAEAEFAARRSASVEFDGLSVRQVGQGKAELIVKTSTGDGIWSGYLRTGSEYQKALISGQVRVSQARQVTPTETACLIVAFRQQRTRGTFRLRRRILADAIDNTVTRYNLRGLVNDGTFLDYPSGTLKFVGHEFPGLNAKLAGNKLILIDYVYEFDSLKHLADGNVDLGWRYVAATGITGPSLVMASTFGFLVTLPSDTDFGVFLT